MGRCHGGGFFGFLLGQFVSQTNTTECFATCGREENRSGLVRGLRFCLFS